MRVTVAGTMASVRTKHLMNDANPKFPDTVEEISPFDTAEERAARGPMKGMTVGTWDDAEGLWKTDSVSLVEFAPVVRQLKAA